jgi:transposase
MGKAATPVHLSEHERTALERWVRASTTQQRHVFRARIVLMADEGHTNVDIAGELDTRPTTVGKWRKRFAEQGIEGLLDESRSGRPAEYDDETEQRILDMLDEPPPEGYATWNGRLVAEALGDVSADHVWRVLRRLGISLQRRHSFCVSTDPEFVPKAADIVGLYLAPPENAVVLCVDEKPSIQALERAQGWLKLPNGRALTGFSHEYKRHGTTTLFAALDTVTGLVKGGHYNRRRRREFLDFMNEVIADYDDDTEIHVVLDNLNTHKPKDDRWLRKHNNVHFHFTPTHASWLNQIEIWFSILSRAALKGASFESPRQVRQAIDRFIDVYNETAAPFEWKKRTVTPGKLRDKLA